MALTVHVSDAEVSANPDQGKATGDTNPAATQAGVITKFRDADATIATDLSALKTIWDAHDHDPANPTGAGGPPIGTGEVEAIQDGAITNALIAAGAITGAKTAAGAVGTSTIADESVETAQLGAPSSISGTLSGGSSWTWTHNKGYYLLFHVEAPVLSAEGLSWSATANAITVSLASGWGSTSVTIRYYG